MEHLIEYKEMREAIQRVRAILKEITADKGETGLSRSEHLVVVALADRIYQALDGANGSSDDVQKVVQ